MKVLVERIYTCSKYTIGKLYVDGEFVCDTIEDSDSGLDDSMPLEEIKKKKVYGETAIPCGIYKLNMNTVSPKFKNRSWAKPYQGKIPRFEKVKGFEGVLIHIGNSADDLLGCVATGENKVKGRVINSTVCFNKLMNNYLLKAVEKGEEITVEIKRKYKI